VCTVCSQSGGSTGIGLFTYELLPRDRGGRSATFMRIALKVIMQNDGDLVEVIKLQQSTVIPRLTSDPANEFFG
jgi:hypothetical protein